MQEAVEAALPAEIAVMAAAVADWRVEPSAEKIKKDGTGGASLDARREPRHPRPGSRGTHRRPRLLIGFAAETEDLLANASAKLKRKGADWIVANDVSPETGIMGGARNRVHLITPTGVEDWPEMSKAEVARRLVERIAAAIEGAPAAPDDEPQSEVPEPAEGELAQAELEPDREQAPARLDDGSLDIRPTR